MKIKIYKGFEQVKNGNGYLVILFCDEYKVIVAFADFFTCKSIIYLYFFTLGI